MNADAFDIVLLDRKGLFGRGVAYSTGDKSHLLNVPATGMSAFSEDPTDFVRWLKKAGKWEDDRLFYPRAFFGDYICEILSRTSVKKVQDEVVGLQSSPCNKILVQTSGGLEILADDVVLAMGNYFSRQYSGAIEKDVCSFYQKFWEVSNLPVLSPEANVAILGSGLSAVDALISLKSLGLKSKVFLFSRHGFFSNSHSPGERKERFNISLSNSSPLELLRVFQSYRKFAKKSGFDWRHLIDSIRPVANTIWGSWTSRQKTQFRRYLRRYWEVHRHRLPPEMDTFLKDLLRKNEIQVIAVKKLSLRSEQRGIVVQYQERGTGCEKVMNLDFVFDCTGFEKDLSKVQDSLLESLRKNFAVRFHESNEGLLFDGEGRVATRNGCNIYCVGSLRRGQLFETSAVPELRDQVKRLAIEIANRHLGNSLMNKAGPRSHEGARVSG